MQDRTTPREAARLLEELLALDYDALEIYQSALERLDDDSLKKPIEDFRREHQRHVEQLRPLVQRFGGNPPDDGDYRGTLAKGRIAVADWVGDKAVLKAVHDSAENVHEAYSRAAGNPDLPDQVHEVLARFREDEHRHRDWLAAKIRAL